MPLPLSLLSPIPLSDPHLFSRSPVMVVQANNHAASTTTTAAAARADADAVDDHHHHHNTHQFSQQPPSSSLSDHLTTPTCSGTTSASDLRRGLIVQNNTVAAVMGFEDSKGAQISNDDASKASVTPTRGATAVQQNNNNGRTLSCSDTKQEQVGRWFDGDKAIPPKKRRGMGFNCFVDNSSTIIDDKEKETMMTTRMMVKWKTDNEEETKDMEIGKGSEEVAVVVAAAVSAKKGNLKRGNTIMEGSRCSRVNGRGWRCCQPTLVGYSLCEHHLGKGRLRSMTSSSSARARSSKKKATKLALGRDEEEEEEEEESGAVDSEKKLERMSSLGNKRVKLGVVKARSLSSLLGQTNTMNMVADHANMQLHENINNLDPQ